MVKFLLLAISLYTLIATSVTFVESATLPQYLAVAVPLTILAIITMAMCALVRAVSSGLARRRRASTVECQVNEALRGLTLLHHQPARED